MSDNQATPTQVSEFDGYTPGEWYVRDFPNRRAAEVCCHDPNSKDQWHIAEICGGLEEREIEANARLIAAAPRLLRERDEARALLEETIIYVEECEQYHKPQCRTLSNRIKALLSRLNTQGGAQ